MPHEGLLLSRPTTTLLMGTDHADRADRSDANRSDSIMLVRTDPDKHRISYLSIPRDLRVDIPGFGPNKYGFVVNPAITTYVTIAAIAR